MNSLSEPVSKRDATRVHADERQRRQTVVALDYLVRDPADGAPDVLGREDDVAVNGNARQRKTPTPERERSEEHTSELQSRPHLVCRLLLEKKKTTKD